jgi:integrase
MKRSKNTYKRTRVSFTVADFDSIVGQISDLAVAGVPIDPARFYPQIKKHGGVSKDLPMSNPELREALEDHVRERLAEDTTITPNDPLFITQKNRPYSPNTLQEHMALMLRKWAGVEKASSHSGRRTVITDIIHRQKLPLNIAQKVAGHVDASTTIIYCEPGETEISDALENIRKL